jgi:heme exporter protein A
VSNLPLIRCHEASIHRGDRCLIADLDWSVNAGELWQVTGDNGTGKTSLLRVLAGLAPNSLVGQCEREGATLYLGHKNGVKADFSPRENLALSLGADAQFSAKETDRALQVVGLGQHLDEPAYRLSAGQQRRIGLARLVLPSPRLWILDEPLTAIDVSGVGLIERCVNDQIHRGGAVDFPPHQPLRAGTLRRVQLRGGRGVIHGV